MELSATALVIAGTIQYLREMNRDMVPCLDCRGTGAADPDCDLCHGERSVRLKALHAKGWSNSDLVGIDGDGWADCPRDGCEGDTCPFCDGEGKVPRYQAQQQARRVLIYAKYGKIPPVCTVDSRGRRWRNRDQYLSLAAAEPYLDNRSMMRKRSILSDDISWWGTDEQWLTAWRLASRQAAMERALVRAGDKGIYYGERRRAA